MLRESHLELVRTRGSKFGRILMGLLFLASGLSILLTPGGITNFVGYSTSLGIPFASLLVWVVIIIKIGAGGALMVGRYVPEAAATLIIFTLVVTAVAHLDFSDPTQVTQALKNLAIVGGLLYIMAFGPGGMNVKEVKTANSPTV